VFVLGCTFTLLALITALVYDPRRGKEASTVIDLLALVFIGILPMYLIGDDWGRNVMIITMSYLLLLFTVDPRHAPALGLTDRVVPLLSKIMAYRRVAVGLAISFCLTFSYPEFGNFPGQASNPLSFVFYPAQRVFHSVAGGAWVETIDHF